MSSHGIIHGRTRGITHGIDRGLLVGVTRDSSSLKYTPANAAEWDTVLAAAGVGIAAPNHLFLCQEASGNLTDTIGGASFALVAANTPLYSQTISGWTRVAVGFTDGASNRFLRSTDFPDPVTTAYCSLVYMGTIDDTPAVSRVILAIGNTTQVSLTSRSDGKYRCVSGANQSADSAATFGNNIVHCFSLFTDPTGNVSRGGDERELLTPTHADASGIRVALPNSTGSGSAPTRVLYMAIWTGADAITLGGTLANLRSVKDTLGWTVAW